MATARGRRANLVGSGMELKMASVAGAAANTNIPVTGLKKTDLLVGVLDNSFADHSAAASITSAGNIQITTSTASSQLLVFWWSV